LPTSSTSPSTGGGEANASTSRPVSNE
jgi:hypothetical protein